MTRREEYAETIAQHGYRKTLKDLSDGSRESCLRIADQMLLDDAERQCEEDKVAAQTWGGDIDLVSFEGE